MIHVCYAGNAAMFKGILISLVSVASSTKEPIATNLLTGDFSKIDRRFLPIKERERRFLEDVLRLYHPESQVALVDMTEEYGEEISSYVNAKGNFTPYALLRLFFDVLPLSTAKGRILYIDVDADALKDISPLYFCDMEGKSLAMVPDAVGRHWIRQRYCNSGVILFDMEKVRASQKLARCRKMVKHQAMFMPDQSAINKHFKKDILILDRRYNEQEKVRPDTVIRHFCRILKLFPLPHYINAKPWHPLEEFHAIRGERELDDVIRVSNRYQEAFLRGEKPSL